MGIIDQLLGNVPLPRMARIRQDFPDDTIRDVPGALSAALAASGVLPRLIPGAEVAIAVGSRGMRDLSILVATLVGEFRRHGARPFIVPAMGSHGGATPDGQTAVLAGLGVTEQTAGCPIRSSMETVSLGTLPNGLPVLIDRHAQAADAIVVVNRIKPHTSFSGRHESGLAKMIAVGLGKQAGAESAHARGIGEMAENVAALAREKIARAPFLCGVATIENAYDRIARIAVLPAEAIVADEPALLDEARAKMPSLPFNPLDVLVVDAMGKEYSGTGTDPNITGRASTAHMHCRQVVGKMAVLDLAPGGKGNATGVGLADICTRRLFDKIDLEATYANHLTSNIIGHARIPMIMANDRLAIQAAVRTCGCADPARLRLVRIANTLHLEQLEISVALLSEARADPRITVLREPAEWAFDTEGNLRD